jgi:hypothetical protein
VATASEFVGSWFQISPVAGPAIIPDSKLSFKAGFTCTYMYIVSDNLLLENQIPVSPFVILQGYKLGLGESYIIVLGECGLPRPLFPIQFTAQDTLLRCSSPQPIFS